MYSEWIVLLGLFVIILAWLAVLSYLFFKEKKIKELLFPKEILETKNDAYKLLINRIDNVEKGVEEIVRKDEILSKHLKEIAKDGLHHVQKVYVSRYNPYEDTGGDQSFSIALFSGNLDGIIVTSLHSRAGTRIYAKIIKAGKSDLELSKEEKEVLTKAVGSE